MRAEANSCSCTQRLAANKHVVRPPLGRQNAADNSQGLHWAVKTQPTTHKASIGPLKRSQQLTRHQLGRQNAADNSQGLHWAVKTQPTTHKAFIGPLKRSRQLTRHQLGRQNAADSSQDLRWAVKRQPTTHKASDLFAGRQEIWFTIHKASSWKPPTEDNSSIDFLVKRIGVTTDNTSVASLTG